MNFYPFHIGDYASSTRHLSWDEDLAYRRLIDAYYTHEKPIPVDERLAFRLVCASTEDQREAVSAVLNEFFVLTETGWVHYRCEEEISKCVDKKTKASQSAKARWSNATNTNSALPTQSERNTDASEEVCERIQNGCEGNAPNPNPNPITNKEQNLCAAQADACAANEEKPSKVKRKTRLPENFTPNAAGMMKAKTAGLNVQVEVEQFRNFHASKGSTFLDWDAAWMTWVGNAVKFAVKRGGAPVEQECEEYAGMKPLYFHPLAPIDGIEIDLSEYLKAEDWVVENKMKRPHYAAMIADWNARGVIRGKTTFRRGLTVQLIQGAMQ